MQTLLNLVRMTARFFLATKFESIWHKPLNCGHGQGTGSWGPEDCAEVWVHQVQGTMAWGRRLVMGLTGWSEFCGNASYAYGYGSIPIDTFLMGWTSIYQLFWCSPGVQGFDTSPYRKIDDWDQLLVSSKSFFWLRETELELSEVALFRMQQDRADRILEVSTWNTFILFKSYQIHMIHMIHMSIWVGNGSGIIDAINTHTWLRYIMIHQDVCFVKIWLMNFKRISFETCGRTS